MAAELLEEIPVAGLPLEAYQSPPNGARPTIFAGNPEAGVAKSPGLGSDETHPGVEDILTTNNAVAETSVTAEATPMVGPRSPESSIDLGKLYLKDIGKIPLLNAAEEVELAKQIEAGLYGEKILKEIPEIWERHPRIGCTKAELAEIIEDGRRAKQHMTEANLRLVVSAVKKVITVKKKTLGLLDLTQVGNLGLMHAVEKFDYAKGYKFSTYAMWWIRQAMQRGNADQARTIRLPLHMIALINKITRTEIQMVQELGREPTQEELAQKLNMTLKQVRQAWEYARDPMSLDAEVGEDGNTRFGDLVGDVDARSPAEAAELARLRASISQALSNLTEGESRIVAMYNGLETGGAKTFAEIGVVLGIDGSNVSKLYKRAIAKLRQPSHNNTLSDFVQ